MSFIYFRKIRPRLYRKKAIARKRDKGKQRRGDKKSNIAEVKRKVEKKFIEVLGIDNEVKEPFCQNGRDARRQSR